MPATQLGQLHSWLNRLQTGLLIALLLTISGLAGSLILGELGLWTALAGAAFGLVFEPLAAWRLTLRLYRASPIHPDRAPDLYCIVQILAQRAGLPATPTLYYVPSPVLNAFSLGHRRQAAIALSDGLLNQLSLRELSGVLGHEIAHIAHGDLRVMGLADFVSRLTHAFSATGQLMLLLWLPIWFIEGYDIRINLLSVLLLLFSPHLAVLAQLGLSRVREYDADLKAAQLTGDPMALAYALARIERSSRSWLEIILPGWGNPQPSWLRTHPETAERIRRLQRYAAEYGLGQPLAYDQPIAYAVRPIDRLPYWRIGGFWY